MLIYWISGRRKNEKTGDFVVFEGYKHFVSIIAASIVPSMFYVIINESTYMHKVVSFIILTALAYYVLNVILEKSFVMKNNAVVVYGILVVSFFLFLGVGKDVGFAPVDFQLGLAIGAVLATEINNEAAFAFLQGFIQAVL